MTVVHVSVSFLGTMMSHKIKGMPRVLVVDDEAEILFQMLTPDFSTNLKKINICQK